MAFNPTYPNQKSRLNVISQREHHPQSSGGKVRNPGSLNYVTWRHERASLISGSAERACKITIQYNTIQYSLFNEGDVITQWVI